VVKKSTEPRAPNHQTIYLGGLTTQESAGERSCKTQNSEFRASRHASCLEEGALQRSSDISILVYFFFAFKQSETSIFSRSVFMPFTSSGFFRRFGQVRYAFETSF
jgi:hypothetical protein